MLLPLFTRKRTIKKDKLPPFIHGGNLTVNALYKRVYSLGVVSSAISMLTAIVTWLLSFLGKR